MGPVSSSLQPEADGQWVRYSDHRSAVEKLEAERDEAECRPLPEELELVLRERNQALQALAEYREGLLLLAITHFDHERLLTDENFDATDLFERGLLEHCEFGQTGEYEARLTAKGFEAIQAALQAIPIPGRGNG